MCPPLCFSFIALNYEINSNKVIKKLAGRAAAFISIYLICGLPCKDIIEISLILI